MLPQNGISLEVFCLFRFGYELVRKITVLSNTYLQYRSVFIIFLFYQTDQLSNFENPVIPLTLSFEKIFENILTGIILCEGAYAIIL